MLKVDLRQATDDDMIVLARILLGVGNLFSSNGYKIHIKRTQSSKSSVIKCVSEQKFSS